MQTDHNNENKVIDTKFDVSSIGDYDDTKTEQIGLFGQRKTSRNEVNFFAGCTDGISYKEKNEQIRQEEYQISNKDEKDEEADQFLLNEFRSPSNLTSDISRRASRDLSALLENRKNISVCSMLFNSNKQPPHISEIVYKPVAGNICSNISQFKFPSKENSNNGNKRVTINIGGVRFETYKTTLRLIQESRLANLTETNSDYDPVHNEYFFDRDPNSFLAILNYYRTGKLHAPADVCGNLFYEELNFWGISEQSIQPCCWTNYSAMRDCDEILRKVMDSIEEPDDAEIDAEEDNSELNEEMVPTYSHLSHANGVVRIPIENRRYWFSKALRFYQRYRPVVWRFFDERTSSIGATMFFWISVFVLASSIISFVLATHPFFRVPFDIATNKSLTRKERESRTVPHIILNTIELSCNLFFSCEFVLRFLSSPNKIKFLRNPYNIFEFLAILPILLPAETHNNKNLWTAKLHGYIEVFYILRILRIFTLVPRYSGLRVLLLTMKNSLGELILYVLMLLMTIMIFASFVFYAEQIFEQDDNKFDSILISLWWAIVTMTTLGYGDIVPATPFGYIVGALCALCGLIFLALPVPVIVNNFATFYKHAKARQKLKENSDVKGLPHRAIAQHIQNTECKNVHSSSSSKDSAGQLSDQSEKSSQYKEHLEIRRVPSSSQFILKLISPKSVISIQSSEISDDRIKCIKIRKKQKTNQYSTLLKWKHCKRRTIRRSAIIDHRTENRHLGSLNFNDPIL